MVVLVKGVRMKCVGSFFYTILSIVNLTFPLNDDHEISVPEIESFPVAVP